MNKLLIQLRRTSLGGLIEFSRAVHAEMDAILSAARTGARLVGSRLFVTTFPCHYCARHIVTAGISEVHYIEPYPKSRALNLHQDSITTNFDNWVSPSQAALMANTADQKELVNKVEKVEDRKKDKDNLGKVLFRPFVGISPRLYPKVFLKDRPYKNKITGAYELGKPRGSSPWQLHRNSYAELEVKLVGKR
jgi:deoxycytidylate deaminase